MSLHVDLEFYLGRDDKVHVAYLLVVINATEGSPCTFGTTV